MLKTRFALLSVRERAFMCVNTTTRFHCRTMDYGNQGEPWTCAKSISGRDRDGQTNTQTRVAQAIQSMVGGGMRHTEGPMPSTPSTSRGGQWKVTRRSGAADLRPRRHPLSRRNHPRRPGRKPGLRFLGRTPTPKPKEKRRNESADQEHRPGGQAHPGRR